MTGLIQRIPGTRRWRSAVLLLCLLATGTVQLAAATHWHQPAQPGIAAESSTPDAPASDGLGHDGCLLCQVAAHAASAAPPPAPWMLASVLEAAAGFDAATQGGNSVRRASHSWQGRAPPRI